MIELSLQKHGKDGFFLNVTAQLQPGSLTALFGPSGSGKTTLLRLLAGLETPDSGQLTVNRQTWFDGRRMLPPQQRRVGLVFQDYALFPQLSVGDNVRFGAAPGDSALVRELLELCELNDLTERRPATLSGGQKQRVALARALASRPQLLLLDEPLSALDGPLRQHLQNMLLEMHQRFELTTILVSHDLAEVFRLADQVLQLENGTQRAFGTPAELFLPTSHDSGRYQLHAEVLAIRPADIMWRLTVLIAGDAVDLLVSQEEAERVSPGQRMVLCAGSLAPLPQPLAAESLFHKKIKK
jgi:molybdate transport system ATP-binding protein